ncbi:glycoside hydrolase family 43 protein [Calocera cornea HHB12733]|uniref:Glycoside hydrolase family 43 protein n=1 Tax=Calocera cornea HHB12733 TaxID=1353952 RepID=A0A165DF92_9BASI|nr:glycoside hydrolase family 43 protein [Calocera cornea HHB12733]
MADARRRTIYPKTTSALQIPDSRFQIPDGADACIHLASSRWSSHSSASSLTRRGSNAPRAQASFVLDLRVNVRGEQVPSPAPPLGAGADELRRGGLRKPPAVSRLKEKKDKPLSPLGTRLYWIKLVTLAALLAVQTTSVVFTVLRSPDALGDERFYTSLVLLVAYAACVPLTHYEHRRTFCGSTALLVFYLAQALLYALHVSPLSSLPPLVPLPIPLLLLALLLALFLLEYAGPAHPLPAPTSPLELIPCPVSRANIFQRLTFSWMTPLMVKGYRKFLEEDDLWALRKCDSGATLSHVLEEEWARQRTRKTPRLSMALIRAYGGPMLTAAALKMCQDCLSYAQPQLLRLLLQFVNTWEEARSSGAGEGGEPGVEKPDQYRGYLIAACMFLVAVVQTMCLNQYFQRCFEVGMRVRAGLVATIYKKALVLSNDERGARATGDIVNLQSVDVMRLQDLCTYAQILWSGPFQITLAFISLYNLMGWSMLLGRRPQVGIIAVFIPLNTLVARYQKKLQQQQMRNKDSRTRLMSEILANIRSIKLYAWEYAFGRRLRGIREDREVRMLRKIGIVNAASTLLWGSVPVLVSFATFTIYVLTSDKPLTSDVIFPAISLFSLLQFPMAMFASVITSFVEASVAIGRLQSFLLGAELQPDAVKIEPLPSAQQGDVLVSVKDGEFKWSKTQPEATLLNVDLELKKGELLSVVGRVGSGKSSLAAAVLGEMLKTEGTVTIRGTVAYAPQQPWIMGGTVRENITFGHRYEHAFYQETIEACGLREDLAILPEGDLTAVGERGVSLSGGQKARISLARAVYSRADIFIMDDPLSAVDAHVGRHIFDHVMGPNGLLASKARLLITNAIPFVQQSDDILMIRSGVIVERGSFREVMAARSDLYRLLNEFGKMKEQSVSRERVEREEDADVLTDIEDGDSDETMAEKEARGFGRENFPRRFSRATLRRASVLSTGERKKEIMEVSKASMSSKEIRAVGSVGLKVYIEYIKACSVPGAIGFFTTMVLMQAAQVGQNLWLKSWGEHNLHTGDNGNKSFYLGVFFAFGMSYIILSFLSSVILWCFCTLRAAVRLHENMFQALMRSPMSFFETVPVGRILNVASRDVAVVDESLARVFSSAFRTFASVFSTILVLTVSSPPFLLFVLPMFFVYRQVQRYYLASSRELKRLDAVSRSPVFASFQETLGGLQSIRAFRQQKRFIAENEARVDANQQAYFPSFTCNRWLAVRLEFLGSCIILTSAMLATWSVITGRVSAGLVGLMMSYATSVTGSLNWMVRSATEIETNAVSIERLEQYASLEPEAPYELPDKTPEPSWPKEGHVQFAHYSTRYRKDGNLVLKDVELDIKPGEKIGIVGRTGAGKSTMTLALYRIIEPVKGTIFIDGVDITKIGLYDLRSRLSIIPQDPQLFEGSVRQNLDPEGLYDDSRIWSALESVQLIEFISQMEGKLDARISEGGSNMSIGQRQLVCLARALLKDTRILVMDEATAAVDVESDEHIQRVIRQEFATRTILTIAHRLNTVMDSTRILVMKEGQVAEFAPPQELLKKEDSLFYGLAKEAGIRLDKAEMLLNALACAAGILAGPASGLPQQASKDYINPILPGFSPDPSCTRVNGTFYCVNSSFNAFPGNVISRPEQLPGLANTNGSTSGVWAASVREHDGLFYVTTTLVYDNASQQNLSRWDNASQVSQLYILFTNPDPMGDPRGWSDPIHFYFPGYDTSLFWDDDGKVWVQGSHAWQIYPQIQQYQIDLSNGQSLSGDPIMMWNGTGGLAPEGPHVYKKNGWYYLLIAEGGTGVNHMATMARSQNITGPWEPYEHNPVLTNANTTLYLQTVGHTDIFNDTAGNYWAVALSTRNGTKNFPMGRETVMVPVDWSSDWPIFNGATPGHAYVQMQGPLPPVESAIEDESLAYEQAVGSLAGSTLPVHYLYLRLPDTSKYAISPYGHPYSLSLLGSWRNLTGTDGRTGNPTFVGRRQTQVRFESMVDLEFAPQLDGEEAGLTVFLQQAQHFDLGIVSLSNSAASQQGYPAAGYGSDISRYIRLRTITVNSTHQGTVDPISTPTILPLKPSTDEPVKLTLRIQAPNESTYLFSWSKTGSGLWNEIGSGDATQVSGGFVGTIIGMFASGNGVNSTMPAYFSNFIYSGWRDFLGQP